MDSILSLIQSLMGKTPDQDHTSECLSLLSRTRPPRAGIGFPRGNDKKGQSGLDEELKQELKKSLKDRSVKSFSGFIYNKCVEKFGDSMNSDVSRVRRKCFACS